MLKLVLTLKCLWLQEVKLQAAQHNNISGGSIYVGSGGVALTYLHLAKQVSLSTTMGYLALAQPLD